MRYIGMTTAIYPALIPCNMRPVKRIQNESMERHTIGTATRNIAEQATIIFFRPKKSHSAPAVSEDSNPPIMTAPTIRLT